MHITAVLSLSLHAAALDKVPLLYVVAGDHNKCHMTYLKAGARGNSLTGAALRLDMAVKKHIPNTLYPLILPITCRALMYCVNFSSVLAILIYIKLHPKDVK